jgi:uncharacterized protein YcbK (DUF882 family)
LRDAAALERFFRCWFTGVPAAGFDARLLEAIVAAARHFGSFEVEIVSAFRHPKYNLMLRKKGREVAGQSRHTSADAVDFRLPGVDTAALRDYLRTVHPGGVGYYPVSDFVHVDFGRKRTWQGT